MTNQGLLSAKAISVELGHRTILTGVDITCQPGRITGLVGPNGAGKSTLIKALAGLIPLASGTVSLDATSIDARRRNPALGRDIAYLPQDRTVHWPLSVAAVVALGRMPHQSAPRQANAIRDADAIEAAMAAMDLSHLADRPVATLSGGELARVLTARTLAQEARVILADEPSAGLDPAHAIGLFATFKQLASLGRTVTVALHDLSLAARFCHDVVMLKGGRVIAAGEARDVLVPDHLKAVFGATMAVGSIDGIPVIVPV